MAESVLYLGVYIYQNGLKWTFTIAICLFYLSKKIRMVGKTWFKGGWLWYNRKNDCICFHHSSNYEWVYSTERTKRQYDPLLVLEKCTVIWESRYTNNSSTITIIMVCISTVETWWTINRKWEVSLSCTEDVHLIYIWHFFWRAF